jgi:hypothetical protein
MEQGSITPPAPLPQLPIAPPPAPIQAPANKLAFIKKGNEVDMATMGVRPLRLQDMLKTAMAQSASKVNVSLEAARQMQDSGDVTEKQASASGAVDHEYALKLASAIEYIAKESSEGKNLQGIGRGPNTLEVSEARGGEHTSDNQGHGHHTVPMSTPLQASGHGPATQMENDYARAPGGPGHQPTAMTAGKGKVASIRAAAKLHKVAEDAINPAHISAGAAVAPDTSAAGESGGAPVGGAPQGPSSLVGSNESAMNYQKGTAYAPRKAELGKYYNEPALSGATDKTLANAFENTGKAGTKFASVGTGTKVAAARAVLEKLAEETKEAGIMDKIKSKALPLALAGSLLGAEAAGPVASRLGTAAGHAVSPTGMAASGGGLAGLAAKKALGK